MIRNDGSLETPFATITHAISTASDGDTIRLNPNTYSESFHFDNKEIVLESRAFELNMMELIGLVQELTLQQLMH